MKTFQFKNTYMNLPDTMYSVIETTNKNNTKIGIMNKRLIKELNLDESMFQNHDFLNLLAGNDNKYGTSIAQAYCGHQFGHLNMLGDGRALLLGEYEQDGMLYDFQLKGSGKTPYSRRGDGLASYQSMLREYLMSEAMNGLGIKTTRSLAVIRTGQPVYREVVNEGAILTRIARSHIRVGTFQYARIFGESDEVKELAEYTIKRHFPEIGMENRYQEFLRKVIKNQAELIASWQAIGFIHGVMNTDNVLISGETIDYGPCAFMNVYDPNAVFSSIDRDGRYAYKNQPSIGGWNLARFAESILVLLSDDEQEALDIAINEVNQFEAIYRTYYFDFMKDKLGLKQVEESLIKKLLVILYENKLDYTNTFRELSLDLKIDELQEWKIEWETTLFNQGISKEEALNKMKSVNPYIIPRNGRVEEVLNEAVKGNMEPFMKMNEVLINPYDYSGKLDDYVEPVLTNEAHVTYCNT